MIENKLKILWISDIHFSQAYRTRKKDTDLLNFATKFKGMVEDQLREGNIDYIFLTGDLAQMGTHNDYRIFLRLFLAPLLDVFIEKKQQDTRLLIIPGNHDVDWGERSVLTSYIDDIRPLIKQRVSRAEFLKKNPKRFEKLFSNYTNFINQGLTIYKDGKYKHFLDFNNTADFKFSPEYERLRLYGYLIDYKRKVIVFMLNTAWFSLGGGFNKLHSEEILEAINGKNGKKSITLAEIESWLKKKEDLSEYSNQVTGMNFFNRGDLSKMFSDYRDFLVITAMHHSYNWLGWDEYFSYADNRNPNAKAFNFLMEHTNVLISGHEHIPKEVAAERIFNNTLHLKSGCFLEDELDLSKSWCSVLNIDLDHEEIQQDKLYFNNEKLKRNWEIDTSIHYNFFKNKNTYQLSKIRRELLSKKFASVAEKSLVAYMQTKYPSVKKAVPIALESAFWGSSIQAFNVFYGKEKELCFVALSEDIYSKFLNSDLGFYQLLDGLFANKQGGTGLVRFLVLDFFVDGCDHLITNGKEEERVKTLEKIVKRADSLFNVMRHQFFVRFEDKDKRPEKELFSFYRKLRFVNTILPYWICEKFWR